MANSLMSTITAAGIPAAIKTVTGAEPSIRYRNGRTVYYWQGENLTKAQAWAKKQLQAQPYDANGLNVDFDWLPVAYPILLPYGAAAVAIVAAAFLLGRFTK